MKLLVLLTCLGLSAALPATDLEEIPADRSGRNIFTNFLGNIGVLRVIPRTCETTSSFLKQGQCMLESKCTEAGGAIAGVCERAGVCCVVPVVCGSQVAVKRSWFVNKEFPEAVENLRDESCHVAILKSEKSIKQVRLDFTNFELGRAIDGSCQQDSFQVVSNDKLLGERNLIPSLCGDNSGQHVYIDMPEGELGQLNIKVNIQEQKGRNVVPRSWRILITQLDETEMAPKGCLQYYTARSGEIKSLNYNADSMSYVNNMNYDICFSKMSDLAKETGEAKQVVAPATPSVSLCRRDFMDVILDQSFTGDSNKVLTPAQRVVKRSAVDPSESRVAEGEEKVITQIQQVVSQLQSDKTSGLRTVVKNANKLAEKKRNDGKDPVVVEAEKKNTDDKKKVELKKADPVVTEEKKGSKVEETKVVDVKVVKPDLKKAAPVADKKTTETAKKDDSKAEQDITWLILDTKDKKAPVAPEVGLPAEKVVNSNVKVDETVKAEQLKPVPEAETVKIEAPKVTPITDFNTKPLGELLAQHDPSKLKDTTMTASSDDKKPMAVVGEKPMAVVGEKPMAVVGEKKPVEMLDTPAETTPVEEPIVLPIQVDVNEVIPDIRVMEELTLEDAQEVLKKPACGGAYLLVQEREVCGTFVRTSAVTGEKDKRFQNAEKISIRSIENAETALRFSLSYNAVCRQVASTTPTTEAPTTTTTTTTTTTPVPTTAAAAATTAATVEGAKPTRRVGVLQYLLGWY